MKNLGKSVIICLITLVGVTILLLIISPPSVYTSELPLVGITNIRTVSPYCLGLQVPSNIGNLIFPNGDCRIKIFNRNLGYSVKHASDGHYSSYCVGSYTTQGE